jgi:hypothetical protein
VEQVLHLVCWSGSVAFQPVAKRSSSVLLTSGTLQPMSLLQNEYFGGGVASATPSAAAAAGRGGVPASKLVTADGAAASGAGGGLQPTAKASAKATELQLMAMSPASRKAEAAADSPAHEPDDTPERRSFLQFSAPHFDAVSDNLVTLFVSEAAVPPPHHRPHSPATVSLLGTYAQRRDPSYLRALGGTIVRLARVVPAGMLVYFASSEVLQNAIAAWRAPCGERGDGPSICQQLEAAKRVFVEPVKATADEFDARLSEFKAVSGAFPSLMRSLLTEICLCHACSCRK